MDPELFRLIAEAFLSNRDTPVGPQGITRPQRGFDPEILGAMNDRLASTFFTDTLGVILQEIGGEIPEFRLRRGGPGRSNVSENLHFPGILPGEISFSTDDLGAAGTSQANLDNLLQRAVGAFLGMQSQDVARRNFSPTMDAFRENMPRVQREFNAEQVEQMRRQKKGN